MADETGQLKRVGNQLSRVGSITPFGAKSEGANADQVKMAGTPAQKKPILQQKAAFTTSEQADPTEQQQQKAQQSQQLAQLKGVQPQLQEVAARRLNEITGQAGVEVASKEILDTAFDTDLEIQALLQQYAADPDDLTPLVTLSGALAQQGASVTVDQIQSWIGTGSRAVGSAAGEFLGDDILMSDFQDEDWGALGFTSANDVAALLGMTTEEFHNMSYAEFQDQVEAVKEDAFSEVQQLEQQLATVPPGSAAYQQIQQRLAELTSAGITTAEKDVQETVRAIDLSNRININGLEYTAEELLSDETIANTVVAYLEATPEERENIIGTQFQGFRNWIESNAEGLQNVAAHMKREVQEFEGIQQTKANLQSKLSQVPGLTEMLGIDLNVAMDQNTLNTIQSQLQNNAIYQVITDPELTAGDQTAITAALTPQLVQSLVEKGTTKDEILKGWDIGQKLKTNPALSQLSGIPLTGDFVLDTDKQNLIESHRIMLDHLGGDVTLAQQLKAGGVLDEVRNGHIPIEMFEYAYVQDGKTGRPVIANPRVLDMMKRGTITIHNAGSALPDVMEKLENFDKALEQTEVMNDPNTDDNGVLSYIMNKDVTVENLNMAYTKAKKLAEMGDTKAQQQVAKFKQFIDINGDGVVDSRDTNSLRKSMGTLTPEHLHKSVIEDIDLSNAKGVLDASEYELNTPENPQANIALEALADGAIDDIEAEGIWDAGGSWLSQEWRNKYMPEGFKTKQEYDASMEAKAKQAADEKQAEFDRIEAERVAKEQAEYDKIKTEQAPEDAAATELKDKRKADLRERKKNTIFGRARRAGTTVADAAKSTPLGRAAEQAQKEWEKYF